MKNNHPRLFSDPQERRGSLQMTLVSPVLGADGNVIITAKTDLQGQEYPTQPANFFVGVRREVQRLQLHPGRRQAEVIPHPQAMDIVLDWHRKIRGEPKSWQEIEKNAGRRPHRDPRYNRKGRPAAEEIGVMVAGRVRIS